MRRHWKLITGIVVVGLIAIGVLGYLWLTNLVDPMPETEAALISDEVVAVETEPWLTFIPSDPADTGLVFYPGGRVPAEAYAPPVRALAEAGFTAVVPSMPFGLAVLDADATDAVIEAHPEVDRWVIAGHSLGGAMAAQYAGSHDVAGLALWAAYPPAGTDLSTSDLPATSVYATEDGLTTLDEVEASRAQLPADTVFVEIEGGNHAGFGWYGEQDADGIATIGREAQQEQVVAATLELLESVQADPLD
jgi:dienelactone hydrolase